MQTTTNAKALLSATPAEIDAALLDALLDQARAEDLLAFLTKRGTDTAEATAAKADADALVAILNAVHAARGGWTRAYKVPGGHVHRSAYCQHLLPTTVRVLLPVVSGLTDEEIVDLAGERACTTCYPDAPVAALSKACRLLTADEAADADRLAAERAERADKAAAKAAKAITDVDGGVLYGNERYDVLATEVTAERRVVEIIADRAVYGYQPHYTTVDRIVAALAAKRGATIEETRAAVMVKVAAKVARERKALVKNGGADYRPDYSRAI